MALRAKKAPKPDPRRELLTNAASDVAAVVDVVLDTIKAYPNGLLTQRLRAARIRLGDAYKAIVAVRDS